MKTFLIAERITRYAAYILFAATLHLHSVGKIDNALADTIMGFLAGLALVEIGALMWVFEE